MSNVTAVILAGGVGTRFLPFANDKTIFPFLGKSLLWRTLKNFEQAGIQKVIVATNANNDAWINEHKQDFAGLEITTHRQDEPKGQADALLALADLLPEKDVLVTNSGDMVAESMVSDLLAQAKGKYALLAGRVTPEYLPVGYLQLAGDRVTGILEKPGADKMPSDMMNLVFHYFSQPGEFLELLKTTSQNLQTDDVYEQALSQLLQQHEVGFYRYEGPWQKLKFGHNVLDMVQYFLGALPESPPMPAQIASTAKVNGNVLFGENVKVFDGAVIQGPCYLGDNVIVGNGSLVRQSIVEANVTIGFGSEIVRSYVGPNCDLHHAYVGDSVLEEKVHFGYGAHTANLRFDQKAITVKLPSSEQETTKTKLGALVAKGSELGVSVSTLPGVTLGEHALVYPGAIVHEAIPDHTTLKYIQPGQELVQQ